MISHEEYLKQQLESKKLELEEIKIQQRITMTVFEHKCEDLRDSIHSIERQLETNRS